MKKITLFMLIVFTITLQGQNKLFSSIEERYDGSSWIKNYGANYEYDSNNNLIVKTILAWDNGVWKIRDKTTYTYNSNNKVIQEVWQEWNTTTNALENSVRLTSTYASSNLIESVHEEWENSNWVKFWKNDFTYASNLLQSTLGYNWLGSQWELNFRETLTYNVNNRITSNIMDSLEGLQWFSFIRTLLEYNENNQILNVRDEEWDGFDGFWEEYYRTDYVFDATGNRISVTYTNSEVNNNYKEKYEYMYDSSSLMSSFAHPFKDMSGRDYEYRDFPYVNKILAVNHYNYNMATSTYNLSSRTTHNYNSYISLSTENFETNNVVVSVYPNPSKDFIQVSGLTETKKIEVYSILGAKVIVGNASNNEKIDIQNLTNGIYFLKFDDGNSIKFIKK